MTVLVWGSRVCIVYRKHLSIQDHGRADEAGSGEMYKSISFQFQQLNFYYFASAFNKVHIKVQHEPEHVHGQMNVSLKTLHLQMKHSNELIIRFYNFIKE